MTALPETASRAATNELLAGLRAGRWRPRAWTRFLARSCARSLQQAKRRPRALAEVTMLHAVCAALAGQRGRRWVAASWALSVCHLGMLETRTSLGLANTITLLRANLPATGARLGRWLPVFALASDLLDGKLARRTGTVSSFGASADALSDAAFWIWFTLRHEPNRGVRIAALAAWAAPAAAITAASLSRGRMVDTPRPVIFRPSAAMQAIVTARAMRPGGTGRAVINP